MKSDILKWIDFLNRILPVFAETVQLNYFFDKILSFDGAIQLEPLEKFFRNSSFTPKMKTRQKDLNFLTNFKSTRYINIIKKVNGLITKNNEVGFENYTSYDELFLDVFDKLIVYLKHMKITDEIVNRIPKYTNANTRDSRTSLENAINDFECSIPTLVNQLNAVAEEYVNVQTNEQFDLFVTNFNKLMRTRTTFKNKWATLRSAVQFLGEGFLKELGLRRTAARNVFYYFI